MIWTTDLKPLIIKPFTEPSDPSNTLPSAILHIFFVFFKLDLLTMIVDQTNIYASTCLGERYEIWNKVTRDELMDS